MSHLAVVLVHWLLSNFLTSRSLLITKYITARDHNARARAHVLGVSRWIRAIYGKKKKNIFQSRHQDEFELKFGLFNPTDCMVFTLGLTFNSVTLICFKIKINRPTSIKNESYVSVKHFKVTVLLTVTPWRRDILYTRVAPNNQNNIITATYRHNMTVRGPEKNNMKPVALNRFIITM